MNYCDADVQKASTKAQRPRLKYTKNMHKAAAAQSAQRLLAHKCKGSSDLVSAMVAHGSSASPLAGAAARARSASAASTCSYKGSSDLVSAMVAHGYPVTKLETRFFKGSVGSKAAGSAALGMLCNSVFVGKGALRNLLRATSGAEYP